MKRDPQKQETANYGRNTGMPENGPDAQYFQEDWCSREANINLVLILCMDINN